MNMQSKIWMIIKGGGGWGGVGGLIEKIKIRDSLGMLSSAWGLEAETDLWSSEGILAVP